MHKYHFLQNPVFLRTNVCIYCACQHDRVSHQFVVDSMLAGGLVTNMVTEQGCSCFDAVSLATHKSQLWILRKTTRWLNAGPTSRDVGPTLSQRLDFAGFVSRCFSIVRVISQTSGACLAVTTCINQQVALTRDEQSTWAQLLLTFSSIWTHTNRSTPARMIIVDPGGLRPQ